jgi:hypothetical protein
MRRSIRPPSIRPPVHRPFVTRPSADSPAHISLVRTLISLSLAALLVGPSTARAQVAIGRADTTFAGLVARLSEPGGFFDSDNLISNETSYLHVITRLEDAGVRGGAYIGVGPDQNYSYLAAIRPVVAYMMDIRRDNALQHLLFKALFVRSRTRVEFLSRWLGRRVPASIEAWRERPITEILAWIDSTALDSASAAAERRQTLRAVESFGVPLDARDRETILRFHATFMNEGLALRFTSFNRFSGAGYPTLRRLILERDLDGAMRSYLVKEGDWQFVRAMHVNNRIIPVVGDLAGPTALAAIGRDVRERSLLVTALYTSNAEMYVWRDGGFPAFATTVTKLPLASNGVIIRSFFDRSGSGHRLGVRGHVSVQLLQRFSDFVRFFRANAFATYHDLITLEAR